MIHKRVLPPAQLALWDGPLSTLSSGWVLYGGTAIALHLGHRQSVDFDFFSADDLDRAVLRRSCSFLVGAKTLQDEPNTLTVVVDDVGDPVKLSLRRRGRVSSRDESGGKAFEPARLTPVRLTPLAPPGGRFAGVVP